MPRRQDILACEIDGIEAGVDTQRLLRSSREQRKRAFEKIAQHIHLETGGSLAVVRLEQGIVAHVQCRRALVMCPFRPGLNERLKALGKATIAFNIHFKCWAVRAEDDATIDRVVRMLLKHLGAVVLDADGVTMLLAPSGRTQPYSS